MNTILKAVVNALIAGDIARARESLAIFPPRYAEQIVTSQGQLTSAGIDEAIGYPLPPELRAALKRAFAENAEISGDLDSCASQIELFQFADETGHLSKTGRLKAVELQPLARQCEILGLRLEETQLPKKAGRVEQDVVTSLRQSGATAVAYEGMPFNVLIALCGNKVLRLEQLGLLEASVVDWPVCDSSRPGLLKPLQASIASARPRKIRKAFRRLHPGSIIDSHYPKISEDFLCELFNAVGSAALSALAEFFLEKPYAHRSGWPDVVAIGGRGLELIEVKARDKLHFSQVRALPRIASIVPGVKVLVVDRQP